MDNDILNLEQALDFFGVSERTLIKLLREERMPARKIGREWRFSKAALLHWLGEGDSANYQNQGEQFRIADDTKSETPKLFDHIRESLDKLKEGDGNIRTILPEIENNVRLPADATLRVSYKRQRGLEKLTFKIFWLTDD